MPRSPVVGVTYSSRELGEFLHWRRMFQGIVAAGATPLAIDCAAPPPGIGELVQRLDGLVISGGGDVSPCHYGGDPDDPVIRGVDDTRDKAELEALSVARSGGLPVLAICRGAQLLNVALGGSLIADLRRDRPGAVEHRRSEEALAEPLHEVTVRPGTLLSKWMGVDGSVPVNSQHHQGIDLLASILVVSASSADGLIEGVEIGGERVVGVQWHPEVLWPNQGHASRLLTSFVSDCLINEARS